ncbi:hypothetical protein POM88_048508 [Heracleum sosnowskyi]|uniref:Uncharacterized protein n=1 Tax=Heracleum sosnowskyi TaxID=360622 RepID=A0AAD8GTY8_9APIA|nr:hypothetical protein POM88_048508 [Heracleum sosnowskyi]
MLTSGKLNFKSSTPMTSIIAGRFYKFAFDLAKGARIPPMYIDTISPCALWTFFCHPWLIELGEVELSSGSVETVTQEIFTEVESSSARTKLNSSPYRGCQDQSWIRILSFGGAYNTDGIIILFPESLVSPYGYICQGHVCRQHMARKWKGKELRRGLIRDTLLNVIIYACQLKMEE